MRPIPVAVIGCGHLGTFHARLYRGLPEAHLRRVVDQNPEKARALGEALGVPWSSSLDPALDEVEAVSVATPTSTHREVAGACLQAGRHALIEKPLAATLEEGRELVGLAQASHRILAVGHTERFNPAFLAAREIIGQPRFVESHRLSSFVPRSLDVDVVLDLMIHDLDLVLSLMNTPVEHLDAVGVPVLTPGEDIANARLRFADGSVANLTASRVSRERVRKIRFFGRHRYLSLDLMEKKAEQVILEQWTAQESPPAPPESVSAPSSPASEAEAALAAYLASRRLRLRHGELPVPEKNALEEELRDFLGAIGGAPLRGASGEDGLRCLELALRIREKVQESRGRLGLDL